MNRGHVVNGRYIRNESICPNVNNDASIKEIDPTYYKGDIKNDLHSTQQPLHTNRKTRQSHSEYSLLDSIYNGNESICSHFYNNAITREMDSTFNKGANLNDLFSTLQPLHIDSEERQYQSEYSELDKRIDKDLEGRCVVYMSGLKCDIDENCGKEHRYPREDKVICKYNKGEVCSEHASDCWFWHPDDDTTILVQSIGDIMMYLRNQLVINPDKYKTRI